MYKKALINLTAVTMAMSVAFGVSLTAFAADGDPATLPVKNTDTWKYHETQDEPYVGDVITNSGDYNISAVYAYGEEAEVNVTGNVENKSESWRSVAALKGGEVNITGNVTSPNSAAEVYDDSSVTINGNVTSNGNGIKASGSNATMTIGDTSEDGSEGNVTAEKTAIIAEGESTTKVYGDVTGSTAIDMQNNSNVIVEGNVSYTENGIVINETSSSDNGQVKLLGTLTDTSDSNDNSAIVVTTKSGDTFEDITSKLPNIVVYEITDDTNLVSVVTDDENISKDVEEYIKNNIQYIIKHDDEDENVIKYISSKNYTAYMSSSLSDKEVVDNDSSILTMTVNSAIKVAVQEGYSVTAGDNVTVTDLGNGVYEIRLNNNKGGVTIKAHLIGGRVVAENTETVSDDEPHAEVDAPSVPFIFAKFTVSPNGANELPTVLGAYIGEEASNVPVQATKVVKVPAGNLTAIEYKNAFIKTVTEAPQDATVILETAMCSCLDKAMVDALATRPDVSVQIVFPKDKTGTENYSVTIPAGYDVNSLVDANGYCGFMYLNSLFGC